MSGKAFQKDAAFHAEAAPVNLLKHHEKENTTSICYQCTLSSVAVTTERRLRRAGYLTRSRGGK